jgi:uncharacterized protein
MRKLLLFSVFVLSLSVSACIAPTNKQPGDSIISYPEANDSFLLRINDLSSDARPLDTIHFVYYSDGTLKSGKQMEAMQQRYKAKLLNKKYVFVGIAHFGNYRVKRRRDFISPSVKIGDHYEGSSSTYGQAARFYTFFKNKIIPAAEERFSGHPIQRSFVGHSLGGLFATYLLVREDSLFSNLYALSPSLWIDNYQILRYENEQKDKLDSLRKSFRISCGSRETVNRVKGGVVRFADTLRKRKYALINYEVKIYPGESHNSSVRPGLEDIFVRF